MQKEWYVVNTYSGHENKVKEKLEMRSNSMGMEDYILRVVVPEQTEVEIKDGVKKEKTKKMFPGYILVEMVMTDEAWFIVRNTPGSCNYCRWQGGRRLSFSYPWYLRADMEKGHLSLCLALRDGLPTPLHQGKLYCTVQLRFMACSQEYCSQRKVE